MKRTHRIPDCHPDRPHMGFGLCNPCYQRHLRKNGATYSKQRSVDPMEGLVRVGVKGWGCL